MQLTNQNIQDLYTFTRKHFVEHYDVQTELVDHLANDIEEIWQENPKLTFEQARDKSFKKFGVFGFMDVVEEKQKQLGKKYWSIIFSFVKEWFKLPKILTTIMLVWLFYLLLTSKVSPYYFFGFWFLYIGYVSVKMYMLKKQMNKRKEKSGKMWLLEDFIFKQGAVNVALIPIYSFQMIVDIDKATSLNPYTAITVSVICTAILILGYISLNVLPKKTEELLEEHYPEYKLA